MASQVIVEDFTGSGTLAGTSPGGLTGVGATWATYTTGGSANNAFTRSAGGATVILPLASVARLDPGFPSMTHSAGVTTAQATVRPGVHFDVLFAAEDTTVRLSINPDGSGAWFFDSPASFGSGSFTGGALPASVVLRIELTSSQTRFYVGDALAATHGVGMSYGAIVTNIRIWPLSTFGNGEANGTTVVALHELQAKTEAASGPLGPAGASARVETPGPLQALAAMVGVGRFAQISVASPLGAGAAHLEHDFTDRLEAVGAVEFYVCDLVEGSAVTRIPISSWQGTLQLDGSCYLQAVVPAAADFVAIINALGPGAEFVISRCARLPDGAVVVSEMARSVIEERQLDQGPQRYTCTLSGYSAAMAAPVGDGPPVRVLRDLRSVSSGTSGVRVRCAIDWFLRPGAAAMAGALAIVPDWINYYVGGGDAYMDAGERA